MKKSGKLLVISILIGFSIWVFNAVLDSVVFRAGSVDIMLWSGLNTMQITHRFITMLCFVVFGIAISSAFSKLKAINAELFSKKEELNKRVSELDCLFGLSKLNDMPEFVGERFSNGLLALLATTLGGDIRAKIVFDNKEYYSEGFRQSNLIERYPIEINGEEAGIIELQLFKPEKEQKVTMVERKRLMIAVTERAGKIIERRRSKEQLKAARDRLRLLASYLHSSREKERQAIAREIHDELGQVLTALKINLSVIIKQLKSSDKGQSNEFLEEEIGDMKQILDETIKKVRKLITELRPEVLDNLGIVEALIWQTNAFREQTGINIEFQSTIENIDMSKDASISLFRIYQESLTNVARHSEAKYVKANFFKRDGNVVLTIEDNGKGMPGFRMENTRSFGLLGMRERALICEGNLTIDSKPGIGTLIEASIPVNNSVSKE